MQDPEFGRGVWVLIHHGPRCVLGRIDETRRYKSPDYEQVVEAAQTEVLEVHDAFEVEFLSMPVRDARGSVGMQHQTMMRPIGFAMSPTTVHVRVDRMQFEADLTKSESARCKETYDGLVANLRRARAAESGISIVESLDGIHKA